MLSRNKSSTQFKLIISLQKTSVEDQKIKELQDKLLEASNEIEQSANFINLLRVENKQLKAVLEELPEFSSSDAKNISDDGKERSMITKLKKKVKTLTVSLQGAEEMIGIREKEVFIKPCIISIYMLSLNIFAFDFLYIIIVTLLTSF